MGCRDRESNFQTTSYEFIDGTWGWWCSTGFSPKYVCHDLDILKERLSSSVERGVHWNVTTDPMDGRYVAIPGEGAPGVFVQA
jgi:hypothetical protein